MAKLYVSPISKEIVTAAYMTPCVRGFCASVGQVGPGAYTGFEYEVFAKFRHECEKWSSFPRLLERDHLGRNGEDMVMWTLRDIAYGFNSTMLHVFDGETARTVMTAVEDEIHRKHRWQLGPGEDDSKLIDLSLWRVEANEYSFPTGCLIDGLTNRGEFDVLKVINFGKPVRGHNCDYLTSEMTHLVAQTCNAYNVAPQLGTLQSLAYLTMARARGLPIREWEEACWADAKNTARWARNERQAVEACGHYHFNAIPWRGKSDVVNSITRTMQDHIWNMAY